MDEAGGKGAFEGAQLPFVEGWDGDGDIEIAEAKRPWRRLGSDADGETLGGEAAEGEILRDVLADAASERHEEQFGRGHALVGGSIFYWLIEHDPMVTGFGGKATAAGMF